MSDLWQDEGFGAAGAVGDASGDDDWDEGEESLDTALEDGFDEVATNEPGWADDDD